MTEAEIKAAIELVAKSFSTGDEDSATPEVRAAAISLLGQVVLDIHRAVDVLVALKVDSRCRLY